MTTAAEAAFTAWWNREGNATPMSPTWAKVAFLAGRQDGWRARGEQLRKYGRHNYDCDTTKGTYSGFGMVGEAPALPCTCGLSAAIAQED